MHTDNIKIKGLFKAFTNNTEYINNNTVTLSGLSSLASTLLGVVDVKITHLGLLTNFPTSIDLYSADYYSINSYLAPYSTLAMNQSLKGVFDNTELILQGTVKANFSTPPFNAAVLITNGNLESNSDPTYIPNNTERVFSIIRFPTIQKASWSDFVAEWRLSFVSG